MHSPFIDHIQASLGWAPVDTPAGKMVRFATSPKAGDKSGYAKLFLDELAGVYGDHRSGESGVWRCESRQLLSPADRQRRASEVARAIKAAENEERAEWERRAEVNVQIWNESEPITKGDPVDLYLTRRGFDLKAFPPSLRYHPDLEHWNEEGRAYFPAMVAAVRNLQGDLVCLHRTYLTHDGRKAPVAQPRKLTKKNAPLTGAAIWLGSRKAFAESETIGVAEGIETAIACRLASGIRTACAISAGLLKQFRWPRATKSLVIFADNDANSVGQDAAKALAGRATAAGLTVRLLVPEQVGTDWADVWAARQKEAA